MMPGVEGAELCRRVRRDFPARPAYLILLTAQNRREEIVAGLAAGADDYLTKPFDPAELRARLQTGIRVMELQSALAARVAELERAAGSVRTLEGLLPLCTYCKKVRDDRDYWQQVDQYLITHTDAKVSHGICPECYAREIEPQLKKLK
jgi:DNA-binding response OmpR family regulator